MKFFVDTADIADIKEIADTGLLGVIQCKSEGIAEGRQSSFGAISFSAFERQFMRFARC